MRLQATQEGLIPLKNWVKSALDHVIQVAMHEPALEFVWVGDNAIDALEQAQTLQILVSSGIKTRVYWPGVMECHSNFWNQAPL